MVWDFFGVFLYCGCLVFGGLWSVLVFVVLLFLGCGWVGVVFLWGCVLWVVIWVGFFVGDFLLFG